MNVLLVDCECPLVQTRPNVWVPDHVFAEVSPEWPAGPCRRGHVEDIPESGAHSGVRNRPGDVHSPTRYAAVPYGTCGRTVWVGTCRTDGGPRDEDLAELVLSDGAKLAVG